MISKMRSVLHTSAYKYILWGFLIVFIVSSLSLGLLFRDSSNTIMNINGYPVTKIEFARKVQAIDHYIKSLQEQLGAHAEYFFRAMGLLGDPSELAANELIREKLLLSAADRTGLKKLSNEYVVRMLKNSTFAMQHLGMIVPQYFYNSLGELNEQAITNHLNRQGISKIDFEVALEEALREFFVTSLIPGALYVSPASVDTAWNQEYAKKRTYTFFEIRIDDVVKDLKKTGVPEQELKNYFAEQNKINKHYWSAEKRSGKAWKFTLNGYGIKDLSKEKFATRFMGDARRAVSQNDAEAVQEFIKKHAGTAMSFNDQAAPTKENKDFAVIEKLFSIKTPGKAGALFDKDAGYIIILDSVKERVFVPFEKVADDVLNDVLRVKAIRKIEMDSNTLLQNNNPETADSFKKNTHNAPQTISINDSWEDIEKKGLPVARMKKMIHPGYSLLYALKGDNGVGVVILDAIEKASIQESDATKLDALERKLYEQESRFIGTAFIDSLQKNATIKDKGILHV